LKRGKSLGIIKRLIDVGYITKVKNDKDLRSNCIKLDKKGLAVLEKYNKEEKKMLDFILSDISVNEENLEKKSLKKNDLAELVEQQFLLNSLEENNNPIRAIFAVNKLNEGWDVFRSGSLRHV
jgi:hypothetical protein